MNVLWCTYYLLFLKSDVCKEIQMWLHKNYFGTYYNLDSWVAKNIVNDVKFANIFKLVVHL